jgi:hypothetical protein
MMLWKIPASVLLIAVAAYHTFRPLHPVERRLADGYSLPSWLYVRSGIVLAAIFVLWIVWTA